LTNKWFVRLDDWSNGAAAERSALEWFIEHGHKVHVAVIPGLLTRQGATYLRRVVSEHPDRVEVGQHGYLHTCRKIGRRRFEVGPGMSRDEQADIIAKGARMLRDKLEVSIAPVFTPPFNGYDHNTVRAVADNGFEVLSAAVRQRTAATGIRLVPVNVDVCAAYFPTPTLRSIPRIAAMTRHVQSRDGFVGVMFHPTLTPLTAAWLKEWSSRIHEIGLTSSRLLSRIRI
jgi:hypothetical protein